MSADLSQSPGGVVCRLPGSPHWPEAADSSLALGNGLDGAGFTLAELEPIAAAYVAGSLGDAQQREVLAAKLDQIEDKRRQLAEMAEFLRAKLDDLDPDQPR